jgi:hypothetical protein
MSHALERADDLAVQVFYFLGEHWFGPPSATEEELAALRNAAFGFSREVRGSEPLVLKARDIAYAVLELLSQFRTPDSFQKLRQASNIYEKARLR